MKRLCLLLASAALLCPTALAAKEGAVALRLTHFYGLEKTGAPKPSANALCRAKFGNYAGWARTKYNINPQTFIMSAQTNFHGVTYTLHPLGLSGQYAFGHFQPPNPIYAVRFAISLQFTNPTSAVVHDLDATTNCLLTNARKAPAMTW